jgi:hypothetical protein
VRCRPKTREGRKWVDADGCDNSGAWDTGQTVDGGRYDSSLPKGLGKLTDEGEIIPVSHSIAQMGAPKRGARLEWMLERVDGSWMSVGWRERTERKQVQTVSLFGSARPQTFKLSNSQIDLKLKARARSGSTAPAHPILPHRLTSQMRGCR